MLRQTKGDLLSISANGKYYYVLVLDRVRLFGGNFVFAFHTTTSSPAVELSAFAPGAPGFHAFVDLLHPKRSNRLSRLSRVASTEPYDGIRYFKQSFTVRGKAEFWRIVDREFNEVKNKIPQLTSAEAAYPLFQSIDEVLLLQRIDEAWHPTKDLRL